MKRIICALVALALATASYAQNVPLQGGPWTAGHTPMYSVSGGSQTVIQDSGTAGGGSAGIGLSELLQVSRAGNGVNTAPYANSGSGPLNTHTCLYDAPTTNATGFHYLCLDANAQGGGLITYGPGGGAPVLPFVFNINGINFSFGSSGFTSVPASSITGQVSVAQGGTGQSTANAGFNALSPMTTQGDTIYGGLLGAATRLPAGTSSQVYVGGTVPSWGNVPVAAIPIGAGLGTSGGNLVIAPSGAGTIGGVQNFTCAAHSWASSLSAGSVTCTQHAFSDLSGSATLAQFPTIANNTALGNVSGSTGVPSALTATQLTTLCNTFTSGLSGCVPASGGSSTSLFLNQAGTFTNPTIGGVASLNSLVGNLTLTSIGGTTVTSSGTKITLGEPGGLINKFRNGTFDIWQRGTSSLATSTSGAYTADGWRVTQAGAAFTCAQVSGPTTTVGVTWALQCVGGTSNTDTTVAQRIESYIAAPFATGQPVTVQFWFKQDTGGAITPKLSTCFASAQDNFATCTADLSATSLTSCATATWCLEAYTFTPSSNASNGYQVTFDCNTALTAAQHCNIAAADIRVTPGATNNTIPSVVAPPELRPVWSELSFSQRYYWQTASSFFPFWNATSASQGLNFLLHHPTTMRSAPTVSATFTGSTNCTPSIVGIDTLGFILQCTSGAAGQSFTTYSSGNTISSEL